MEFLSFEFFAALAAIVAIDLVLAGDNAIVIALAARNVRKDLQKRAMIWGAGAAVVMRAAMTIAVVWLLSIPGLLFGGGVLLAWIAFKLLLPENGHGSSEKNIAAPASFWAAIRTIVVADVVMGVDNVLGVAGAAHGDFILVVAGLLISVPILVWGSSFLLKYIERYPVIMYLGASVLALTAAKMIASEPFLKRQLADAPIATFLLYATVIGGVLWAGFVHNHRRIESKISARVSDFSARSRRASDSHACQGDLIMRKILVPIAGAENATLVVPHLIREFRANPALRIHLLNVQPRFSAYVTRFIGKTDLKEYTQSQGRAALAAAQKALDAADVPHTSHIEVGDKAAVIARMAEDLHCDHIVMSTARKNTLTRMVEDSVTNRVLELTTVPVEMIAGAPPSNIERYGIPAALASILGLVFLAAAE
ncbi:YjbE family putative metal transport protein [Propionivibrio dicarboxylicus]|uniref:Integral membrane protein, YjbE family n=1 Tax=Propionivibrio dicarboxylicus TaxID=83767 RepID=A0A1G8JZI1_9RHOO|nr:YjbE family putative metal transport protein [Propionivibrio dicarboxylicus]SDI36543.1 integral membrane protein, YjbE family [Propionivibrio dicarboxylicus]